MAQQTAVEWLLKAKFELIFDKDMSKQDYLAKRIQIEEQAKQMEKEQIIIAYHKGLFGTMKLEKRTLFADEYYKQTYESSN